MAQKKNKINYYNEQDPTCMVFVGRVPHETGTEEFRRYVDAWPGNKLKTFLKQGSGFGMVEFANVRERDNFISKKSQYNKFKGREVDIKEYTEGAKSQSNKPLKKSDLFQNHEAMVFVGGVPHEVTRDEFEDYISTWKDIKKVWFKEQTGYGSVEFISPEKRDKFLGRTKTDKPKLNNRILDVKAFKNLNVKKVAAPSGIAAASSSSSTNTSLNSQLRSSSPVGLASRVGATSMTSRAGANMSPLSNNTNQATNGDLTIPSTFTAVVLKYVLDFDFGILRTQVNGNGLFSITAVAYCYKHKLICKDSDCPDYKIFNPRDKGYNLGDILPLGTQVNVMAIPFKLDTDDIRFHASLVWPHMSKKPANVCELGDAVMNDIVANYLTWGDGDRPTQSSSSKPPGFAMAPGAQLKPAFSKPNGGVHDFSSTNGIIHSPAIGPIGTGFGDASTVISSKTFFNDSGSSTNHAETSPVGGVGLFPDQAAVWKPVSDQGATSTGSFLPALSNTTATGFSSSAKASTGKEDPKFLDNFLAKLQSLIDFCQKDCAMPMNKRDIIGLSNDILKIASPDKEQDAINLLLIFMKTHNFAQNEREQGIILAKFKVRFHSLCSAPAAANKKTTPADLAVGERMMLNKKLKALKESKQPQPQQAVGGGVQAPPTSNGAAASTSVESVATSELNKILDRMKVNEDGRNGGASFSSVVPDSWTERSMDGSSSTKDIEEEGASAAALPIPALAATANSATSSETSSLSGAASSAAATQLSLFPAKFNQVHNLKQFKSLGAVGHYDKAVKNLIIPQDRLIGFSALETWLQDFLSRVQTPFGNVNYSVMSRAIVYSWSVGTEKGVQALKDDVRMDYDSPGKILKKWMLEIDSSWKCQKEIACICLASIVKLTYMFSVKQLPHSSPFNEDSALVLKCLLNSPAKCSEGQVVVNVKGLVIHYFNDNFGLIQSDAGKVLFDRNLACYFTNQPILASTEPIWMRCKAPGHLPIGTLVKFHAKTFKIKSKRVKMDFMYATKVYMANWAMDEPFSGYEVPGGPKYWEDALVAMETIVRENPDIALGPGDDPENITQQAARKEYLKCFDTVLQRYYSNKAGGGTRGRKLLVSNDKMSAKYSAFASFISKKNLADKRVREINNAVDIIGGLNISIFDLRKDFIAKTFIEAPELFEESLELLLLGSNFKLESSKKICNVVTYLTSFFMSNCPVTNGQIEEMGKLINKDTKGSLGYVQCFYGQITGLLKAIYGALVLPEPAVVDPEENGTAQNEFAAATPSFQSAAEEDVGGSSSQRTSRGASADFEIDSRSHVQMMSDASIAIGMKSDSALLMAEQTANIVKNELLIISEGFKEMDKKMLAINQAVNRQIQGNQEQILQLMNQQAKSQQVPVNLGPILKRLDEIDAWKAQSESRIQDCCTILQDLVTKEHLRKDQYQSELVTMTQTATQAAVQAATSAAIKSAAANSNNSSGNASPAPNRIRAQVKITNALGGSDIFEFATDDNGDLLFSSVKAIYEGVNALKYKTDAGTTRICSHNGDIFESPADGWGNRVYIVNIPSAVTQQPPVSSAPGGYPGSAAAFNPNAYTFPGFSYGQPNFPPR